MSDEATSSVVADDGHVVVSEVSGAATPEGDTRDVALTESGSHAAVTETPTQLLPEPPDGEAAVELDEAAEKPGRMRRAGQALLRRKVPIALVALGLLAVSGGVGTQLNYLSSVRWHQRADARQAERDHARDEAMKLSEDLDEARSDIARMERSLRTTRNQLATAEQQHEQAQAAAEFFVQLSTDLGEAGASLDNCLVRMATWISDQPSYYSSSYTWSSWSSEGEATMRQCSQARSRFDGIVSSLE